MYKQIIFYQFLRHLSRVITKCNSEMVSRVPYKMARHKLGIRVDGNTRTRFSMIVVESKVPSRWGQDQSVNGLRSVREILGTLE